MAAKAEIVSENLMKIEEVFKEAQDKLVAVIPKDLDPMRFWTVALEVIRGETKLSLCEPVSLLQGVMEAAELGLFFGRHLGHAYLVPFKNGDLTKRYGRDVYEATMMIGFRGFEHMVCGDDPSASMSSRIVYSGEEFYISEGMERSLIHIPDLVGRKLVDYIGAYSVFTSAHKKDFEWMTRAEIDKIRRSSKAQGSDSPWNTWTEEMIKKTPIRRHGKRLEIAPKMKAAFVRDEYRELGVGEEPPPVEKPRRKPASTPNQPETQRAPEPAKPTDYAADEPWPCAVCGSLTELVPSERNKGKPPFWGCQNYKNKAHQEAKKERKHYTINAEDWHQQFVGKPEDTDDPKLNTRKGESADPVSTGNDELKKAKERGGELFNSICHRAGCKVGVLTDYLTTKLYGKKGDEIAAADMPEAVNLMEKLAAKPHTDIKQILSKFKEDS